MVAKVAEEKVAVKQVTKALAAEMKDPEPESRLTLQNFTERLDELTKGTAIERKAPKSAPDINTAVQGVISKIKKSFDKENDELYFRVKELIKFREYLIRKITARLNKALTDAANRLAVSC